MPLLPGNLKSAETRLQEKEKEKILRSYAPGPPKQMEEKEEARGE